MNSANDCNVTQPARGPIGEADAPLSDLDAPTSAALDFDRDLDLDNGDHDDLVGAIIAHQRWREEFPQTKPRLRPQIDFFCAALALWNRFEEGADIHDRSFFDFSAQRFRERTKPEVVRDLENELHASRRLIRRLAQAVGQARSRERRRAVRS